MKSSSGLAKNKVKRIKIIESEKESMNRQKLITLKGVV
jgi:hypothetical protein